MRAQRPGLRPEKKTLFGLLLFLWSFFLRTSSWRRSGLALFLLLGDHFWLPGGSFRRNRYFFFDDWRQD